MNPQATVLIPTHDHGPPLIRAINSVLAQTVADLEVFVIGDGVPDVTREIMTDFQRLDSRVRFFDHPKGPRNGEIYRHAALTEARGEIVCYLGDDDLYLPGHVDTMLQALRQVDFAHALYVCVAPTDVVCAYMIDVSLPEDRSLVLQARKGLSLSCGAHTLQMYRRLPHGWRTTPPGISTDIFMWKQFLADPACRVWSATHPTVLHFPSYMRRDWTPDERCAELGRWSERLAHPAQCQRIVLEIVDDLVRDQAARIVDYERFTIEPLRWAARCARRIPFVGEAVIRTAKAVLRGLLRGAAGARRRARKGSQT
jgi:GalNAc5-diNAcBac-PP-undecaprenol beta-1,3-glucosyltransferase